MSLELQELDFLPASYRQRQQHRKDRNVLNAVAVAVGVLAILGTIGHWQTRSSLARRLEEMQALAQGRSLQPEQVAELKEQIARLDEHANLLAALKLQPSPSQLIAETVRSLPTGTSLERFEWVRQRRPKQTLDPGPSKTNAKSKTSKVEVPPAVQDLEEVALNANQSQLVCILTGTAPDDLAVSRILATLGDSPLFSSVRLVYSEPDVFRDQPVRKFSAEVVVRSAHVRQAAVFPGGVQ